MTHYFERSMSLDEAKALYHKLAFENHPDRGGDLRTMQEINAQYARFTSDYARNEGFRRQAEAHKDGRKSAADYHDLNEVAEVLRVKIEAVLNLGLDVELCGLWVWVTGDTYPLRDKLGRNGLGFKYASNKQAWYFAGVPSMNKGPRWSLDEIRDAYGSQKFEKPQRTEQHAEALHA